MNNQGNGTNTKFPHHPNKVNGYGFIYKQPQTPVEVVADEKDVEDKKETHFSSNYKVHFKNMSELRAIVNTNSLLQSP